MDASISKTYDNSTLAYLSVRLPNVISVMKGGDMITPQDLNPGKPISAFSMYKRRSYTEPVARNELGVHIHDATKIENGRCQNKGLKIHISLLV